MTVVAEGVETSDQLAWLRSAGVSQVQGWVYSQAVPPGEAGQVIRRFEGERGIDAPESNGRHSDLTVSEALASVVRPASKRGGDDWPVRTMR